MKQKIKIVTDSCSSLSKEECVARGIECVETTYILDDVLHSAFDDPDVDELAFYKKLDEMNGCSTGCVNVNTFEECFSKLVADGYHVIYMGLSGALSSTYSNAVMAAQTINDKAGKNVVRTVDSRTGSFGIQVLIDDTEKLIADGKNLDEIEFIIKDNASKLESNFICADLKFLNKCGRLSSFEAGLGRLLKIVPIIHVDPKTAKLVVCEKCMGQKLAYKNLKKKFISLVNSRPCEKVYIASSGLDEDVESLKQAIIENTHIKEIKTGYIDKTMACCCGPKTIAIFAR